MKKIVYSHFTRELLDSEYNLGQFDCLQLVKRLREERGLSSFPESFQGITWENYSKHWMENPRKTKQVFIELILSMGKEISLNQIQTGDILVYELLKNQMCVGVYIGDKIFSVYTDAGVKSIKRTSHIHIIKVIRWEN